MAPRPRLFLGWQPLHSGCSLSSFPLLDPAPPLPPSPPPLPREPRELRIPGHARPTQGLVDSGGSRWDKQHGLAAREGPSPKGRDIEERLVEQVGEGRGRDIALSGGTDLVKRKKKKIGEQRRDSGLVRRRHGGGDTNAKKGQGQDGQSWKKGSQAAGCNF